MKGPAESILEPLEEVKAEKLTTSAATGKQSLVKPQGGKALKRLQLFSAQRHLPTHQLASLNGEMKDETFAPSAAGTKSKKGRGAPEKESVDDEAAGYDYAKTLFEASIALKPGAGARAGALAQESVMEISTSPPTATGPQWRFLGPSGMPNGQTYGDTRVVVSGRIGAIAIDPSNSNHILCGSAGGGVWESFNRGANWVPRTDYMPTLATGALAYNPSSPNIVYCGTGEGNFYAGLGAGVLRSNNGGSTWSLLTAAPFIGQGFHDLIVDRSNGNHLLAATTSGVYESANGGTAWTLRRGTRCWDLSMSPAGGPSAEVFAACSDGLFRSSNGGTTYTKVNLPGAPATFNRLAVEIARSNPAIAYVFGAAGNTAYLYQRNAAGAWVNVPLPAGLATSQAWYDWFLTVSPDNDLQIYLGAIEAYRGTFQTGAWSWVTISNKTGDDIHPDQHAIAIDPTNANNVYIGCDGGLFYSPNRGNSWTTLNNGLGITEIEYLAQDYGSSRWLIAGTQDNGTCRYTGNAVWDHIADGDGGDCGVNRANPNIVYHTYYNMGMERSTSNGNFGSFSWIFPNLPAGYNNLFYPPMECCNDTVAMAGQTVYVSRNQGTNWSIVPLAAGIASSMHMPNPNTIYVGTTDGRIYRITWSGSAWSAAVQLAIPRANAWISDLYVDPGNLNRIWATFSSVGGGRVFRSDNGGTSWTDRSAGLPNLPINAVEVHPSNANRVWVAADVGVYQSLDAGVTWMAFANSLPNGLAEDLLFHPNARVLRVALRNRGVWEIHIDGPLANPVCGVQWNGTLAPNETKTWFTFNWPATWHMLWTVMPITPAPGAKITAKISVQRASAEYVTYFITVTNMTNQTVNFEGRYEILSYY